VIWRYAQGTSDTARTLVIKLPNPTYKSKEPLPLGVLVHDIGAGELALLMIRSGGKVSYYESVTAAANADALRQKQQGLHGSVSGLLSGENVSDVTEAEPDGFVLTTNAGRVVHLSVRDSQGKPSISTQLLRGSSGANGGLLGGLRNVLSIAGWRKDIAAVKCPASREKGHRKCIVATKQGVIQVWGLTRHSNKSLELEINTKQTIYDAVIGDESPGEIQVLDFAFYPGRSKQDAYHILLLVGLVTPQKTKYSLVESTIRRDTMDLASIYPITCWNGPLEEKTWLATRSKILLPDPGHTAFVIFDKALIVASLTHGEESPDSQLQRESNTLAEPFQDILFFSRERDFHIVGTANEPANEARASCLFLVNDFGLAHMNALKMQKDESIDARRASLCRSKIEQAVFFGDTPNKLFDFHQAMDTKEWKVEEIEIAALDISRSILESTSKYLPAMNPSMDHLLKDRATALKALIKFCNRWDLGSLTRWELLWNAEKMAAARAVWQVYQMHLSRRDEHKIVLRGRNTVLLWEALDAGQEDWKREIRPEKGENDVVRQYLTYDVTRLDLLVAWTAKGIEELWEDKIRDTVQQAWLISQAADVAQSALRAAFNFREQNASLYGFPDSIEDGIYSGSYEGLPEIWTSCRENYLKVKDLANLARESAIYHGNNEDENLDFSTLTKLAQDAATLAHLTCQLYEERYLFYKAINTTEANYTAKVLKARYLEMRRELLVKLVDIELPDEGIKLAEKYRDLGALAEILCRSKEIISERLEEGDGDDGESQDLENKATQYEQKVAKYFRDYGMKWAQAYYSELMNRESISHVMKAGGQFLQEFLRNNPELVKARWMYETCSQRNHKQALQDLLKANAEESNLWNKKVELSLAKLSLFAAKEKGLVNAESVTKQARHANRRLNVIDIQDRLYAYTRPILRSAIDHIAEADLAMESLGGNVKKRQTLAENLKRYFEKLVRRQWLGEENLIDTLTLISSPDVLDDADFASLRFFYALQTVRDSPFFDDTGRTHLLQQIIWRRCILQDNWQKLNLTELKEDSEVAKETESTALFKTLVAGFDKGNSNDLEVREY
jgi:nuclear pore complex protein Nup133